MNSLDETMNKLTSNPVILALLVMVFAGLVYGYIVILFAMLGG